MKQLKAILALAAGICIFFACTPSNAPYPEAMQKAMRCMEERSDSAQIYLSSLDSVIGNEPEETQMYYGLLKTKAEDKEYVRHTSDSLMKEVVHFYESHHNTEKLMEAYHYLGSVYRDMKDAPRAMVAFLKAIEVGGNTQRYDILGRVYEQMGTILAYQSLYEDALKVYKTSYAYKVKQKEGKGIVYALRNQGRMYEVLNRLDSAEYYYQAAYKKAFEINDQQVINSISIEFGNMYLRFGKPTHAMTLFSEMPQKHKEGDAIYLYGLGSAYMAIAKPDSAQYYYKEALKEGKRNQNIYMKSSIYKALSTIEAQKGDYPSAFEYAEKSFALEDSIKEKTRTEAIGKIHALYNYRHTEEENQQLLLKSQQTQIYIYLLIIAVLLIAGIYFNQKRLAQEQIDRLSQQKEEQEKYSQDRLNKNRNEIQEIQKLLQQAKAEKEEKNSSLIQAQTELQQIPQLKARLTEAEEKAYLTMAEEKLLKARLTETEEKLLKVQQESLELENRLIKLKECEKIIQKDRFEKTSIYKHFHEAALENGSKKIKEEDWISLVEEIDKAYNDFTDRLKTLYPSITPHELRMCYLIKANIAPSGMAKILCKSASGVSNGRARLYQKISKQDGNGEMLDKLISDL